MLSTAGVRPQVCQVVLFYPTASLTRQIREWGERHGGCLIRPANARSLPEIREVARDADVVVVDATEDYAQAVDAFSQAMTRLGADGTAVYTEEMHEGLELFVRVQGALLLFGPLEAEQWQGFFRQALATRRQRRLRMAA